MTLRERLALEVPFYVLRARKLLSGVYYRIPAAIRPKPKVLAGHATTAVVFALAKFSIHLSPAEAAYASVAVGALVAWLVRDEKKPEAADDAESPTMAVPHGVVDEGPIESDPDSPPQAKPRSTRRRASRKQS